jgi:hypothetical protein
LTDLLVSRKPRRVVRLRAGSAGTRGLGGSVALVAAGRDPIMSVVCARDRVYAEERSISDPGGHMMVKTALVLALLIALASEPAAAACMQDRWGQTICGAGPCARDREGEVYCAPTRFGSVARSINGQLRCAPGQCVRTLGGDDICSDVDGGGAVKQLDGTVRCQGSCITASPDMCEYTRAGR